MGGNALKKTKTRRFSAVEYRSTVADLLPRLKRVLSVPLEEIPSFEEKESFGDCDVIVESNNLKFSWGRDLIDEFGLDSTKFVKNTNVFSFAFNELQIDLILTPKNYFHSSLNYFSFNDLGNLVGRISHKLGIKYGHRGLSLVVRDKERGDHILEEIQLASDDGTKIIYEILGLPEKYSFKTRKEIFEFVASSKFFDPAIFLLDNRNSNSKIRDRKRVTYREFLCYCAEGDVSSNYSFEDKKSLGGYSIREPWFSEIVVPRFPWVKERVESIIIENEKNKSLKRFLNAKDIGEAFCVEGKELGEIMKKVNPILKENRNRLLDGVISPNDFLEFLIETIGKQHAQ